jgi:threonine synthase
MSDGEFVALVERCDRAVADLEGHGFRATPFGRNEHLSESLGFDAGGGVWVKDETGNVAGSHKGRHLMGVLLHLEVAEGLGLTSPGARPPLAIASCGNAALAAAVVAASAHWPLRVFVPEEAGPGMARRLEALGAEVVVCQRRPGALGDPAYARLREEIGKGALPFTCQGNENGLAIEGGETLGYELVSDLLEADEHLDHLVVQVGGGALASACMQAFDEAAQMGAVARRPRSHTVQTFASHPLERAYRLVQGSVARATDGAEIGRALRLAASHRSGFMWPWEGGPKSMATGVLDDETYDWLAVVGGMLRSGGRPMVVSEDILGEAHRLGTQAGYSVDATGTAGLAGLLCLVSEGVVRPDEKVAVVFTGTAR